MPTSYTSLLGLALPVTGELSGTWGDTVNDYITQYLDASVAGTQTISGSQTAVTLSKTTAVSLSQAGSGATGSSQYNIINCTGNPASMLTVTVPAASKTYVVVNATSTNQDVKIVGAGPTTGVTLVAGEKAVIAWNGSDFIKVATSTADGVTTLSFGSTGLTPSTATSGAVTVAGTLVAANGGTGQSSYTTGDLLYATGSTALSKLGIGTNGQILTSTGTAPQWSTLSGVAVTTFSAGTTGFTPSSATSGAVTLAGTLATTNGGTGLTSFTANGVVYASSSSALTTGSALTFDGTTFAAYTAGGGIRKGNAGATVYTYLAEDGVYAFNTDLYLLAPVGRFMAFYANNAEQMRLTSTGLGIGTSSPATKLDVVGSAQIGASTAKTKFYSDSTYNGIFNGASLGSNESIYMGGGMQFFYASGSEQMRLTSTGLGIGTSSPAYKLDVQGAIGEVFVKSTTGTNYAALNVNNTGGNFYAGINNSAGTAFSTTAYSAILWHTGNYPMVFATNNGEKMRLDSSGNLGIGTSSPAAKLHIAVASAAVDGTKGVRITNPAGTIAVFECGSAGDSFIGTTSGSDFNIRTNNTVRATFDNFGNLGLGVTPSAWYTGFKSFQAGATTALADFISGTYLFNNWYVAASGANTYLTSNFASSYSQVSGEHRFFTAPSGTAGNTISFTQAMTLDASGNLGIGTTSPFYRLSVRQPTLTATLAEFRTIDGTNNPGLEIRTSTAGTTLAQVYSSGATANLLFETNSAERARIDSSGNFLVGASSAVGRFTLENAATTVEMTLRSTGGVGTNNRARIIGGYEAGGSDYGGYLAFNTTTTSNVNTERARITSGGYSKFSNNGTYTGSTGAYHEFYQTANSTALLIRATDGSYGSDVLSINGDRTTTNASYNLINAYNGNISGQFIVRDSGNAINTNGSYGTISDAKMKTDILDAGSQWADIKAIRFRKFKMKDDPAGLVQLGVVAQELEQTSPGLVEQHTDRDAEGNDLGTTTKSVKTSVLLMKAAVALQEAMARIEQLEAKVAALETK